MNGNPIGPVRPLVATLAGLEKPANEYTLRQAVEWYKRLIRAFESRGLGEPSGMEEKEINTTWTHLIETIAEREDIPSGFLSYMLGTLVQSEIALEETAEREAARAVVEAEAVFHDQG